MKSIVLVLAVVFVAAVAFANGAPSEGAITTSTTSTAAPTTSSSSTTPVPTTSSEAPVTERHPKTLGDLLLLKLAKNGYFGGPPPPVYGYPAPYGCNPLGFCG